MAFPDDYRRVQQAGGTQSQVESTEGLPRQILIDMQNLSPRLMDGVTLGGHKFAMQRELPDLLQSNIGPEGEVDYVKDQVTNDPDDLKRFWRSSKLRTLFQMIADMTNIDAWIVKDSAMPAGFRASAILIADMDLALVDGFYRFVPNGALNIPAGLAGTDQYMALVIRQSSSELTQIIYSRAADGKIWIRSRVGGVFQAWNLATGITMADLALKVAKAGDTMSGKLILPVPTNVLAQLNLRTGVSVAAPNDGDIWRDDSAGGIKFRKGGVTKSIFDEDTAVARDARILHVRDEKAAGVTGGSSVAGVQVRTLNTVVVNGIAGASLGSNRITLPAGVYDIEASAPFFRSGHGQLSIRDSGGNYLLDGQQQFSVNGGDYASLRNTVLGRVTIAISTTIELAHYTSIAYASAGLGPTTTGTTRPGVFAEVIIRKVD